jgi:transcriptional regulator EpsA
MSLMVSPRVLEYFGEAITSCQTVRNLSDLFMWSQGPLWAYLPHDVMLFSVANSQSQWVLSDCLHSQPLKGQVVNALIDRHHGLLSLLIQESRKLEISSLYIDSQGQSEQPIAPELSKALTALKLGGVWFADTGALSGFHRISFALLGAQLQEIEPRQMCWIAPSIQAALCRVSAEQYPAAEPLADETLEVQVLTARQMEIMKWVRQGKTNHEVGAIMGISPFTVKNHLQKIFQRLKVNNRVQAVAQE